MKRQIFTVAAIITVLGLSACQVQKETETVTREQNEMGSAAQLQKETGIAAQAQTGAGAAGHGVFDIPVQLEYARKFTITKDSDGCSLLTIDQGDPVVGIPEGK